MLLMFEFILGFGVGVLTAVFLTILFARLTKRALLKLIELE